MSFTESERQLINKYLTEKTKMEIEDIVGELDAVYEFIEKRGLNKRWMGDSERFMGFGFFHTKALVKHSIVLSRLTWALIGLTAALFILSFVQLVRIWG
ncbi:MAG: hypothetical protein HYX90_08180 [Chloroflexi bacterium]|nr:hypothetical protein [Chloroflexota bacterium]